MREKNSLLTNSVIYCAVTNLHNNIYMLGNILTTFKLIVHLVISK